MAYKKILFRRDLAATWTSVNPILSAGEIGLESDTGKIKLGNGSTAWTGLTYFFGSLEEVEYVDSITSGTGVTVSGGTGNASTPSISIGQNVATSASPTFAQITVNNLPSNDNHVASKAYVDGIASSINWHDFTQLATAAVLPNTPTYSNGTNGVGATLTASENARLVVDGTNATTGNRIIVKNQENAVHNGIYDVTAQGSVSANYVLTRSTDFDSSTYFGTPNAGDAVYVGSGALNAGQGFLVVSTGTGTDGAHIIGTDSISFTQFSGTAAIFAGTGITKTGNQLSIGQNVATSASVSFAHVTADLGGTAFEATKLKTARDIAGKPFDGTANISIEIGDITNLTVTSAEVNKLAGIATTSLQLDYLNSASANIQTQLNEKATAQSVFDIETDLEEKADLLNPTFYQDITANNNIYASEFHGNVIGLVSDIDNHELNELLDVSAASPSDGQFLVWNSSASAWIAESQSISEFDIGDLANVSASASSGQYLKYNGTEWSGDFVELGSETTGNYVASVIAGTGVSLTDGVAQEAGTPTISIGQAIGSGDSPQFAGLSIGNTNLSVNGNLAYSAGTNLVTVNTLSAHGLYVGARITVSGANQEGFNGDFTVAQVTSNTQFKYTPTLTPSSSISSGSPEVKFGGGIIFEGSSPDEFETFVTFTNPTADRIISFPDANTTLVGTNTTDTLTNKTLTSPVITGVSPTLTLSGDVSGSVTLTDLGNATMTTAIQPNSVALGTDTTGNYVANLVAGTGITITDNAGESATPTISIPQDIGTSASVTFGTLVVTNLFATNNQSTSQANLNVSAGEIVLNSGTVGAPTQDGAIIVDRGSSASVEIRWNETQDRWEATNDGSNYHIIAAGAVMYMSETPPATADSGDFWFETDSGITFVYYDNYWVQIGASGIGAVVSSSEPENPANGQFWFKNTTNEVYVFYNSAWVIVSRDTSTDDVNVASIMGAF